MHADGSSAIKCGFLFRQVFILPLATAALTTPLLAQTASAPQEQRVQAERPIRFDIPAQPLDSALAAFGAASGMQILYDSGLTAGLRSPGVSGTLAPQQALRQLLAGTGLSPVVSGPNAATLQKAGAPTGAVTLDAVQVEGRIPQESAFAQSNSYRAASSTVGSKTDALTREVPASVQVVPQQVIADQRQFSVTDALTENVSGVNRDTQPWINGDNLRIRGFVANGNYLRDGVPDNQIGRKTGGTLADVERVEVLKGPASVLYGLGSPGGTVNILTKQPLYEPLYEVGGTLGSHQFRRADADVSHPVTADGRIAGRINLAVVDTGAFVDFEKLKTYSVTPVFRFDIKDASRLTLEANYSSRDTESTRSGLPAIGTLLPGPNGQFISRSRNLDEPANSGERSDTFRLGYRFETELDDTFTFRSQGDRARYRLTGSDYGFLSGGEAFGFGLQADGRTYGRGLFQPRGGVDESIDGTDIYYLDNNVIARFDTGRVSHKAVGGISYSDEDALNNNFQISGPFFIDVYNPVYTVPSAPPIVELTNRTKTKQTGFYLQDQLGFFEDRLKLVLGGRYDLVKMDVFDELLIFGGGTPTRTSLRDEHFTGRGGLVFDVTKEVAVYASYAQSYVPQSNLDQAGRVIDPETGEQYEVGVKVDWLGSKLSTTASVFDLTRDNVARTVGLNVSASGKQRSRGVEFDVAGEVMPGWKVIGSYTHMKTEVVSDTSAAEEGLSFANTPDNKLTFFTTYKLQSGPLQDVTVGAGTQYLDERRVANTNTPVFTMPSYWRLDLMAGYQLGPATLQLNVLNVFDKRYFVASQDSNRIFDGDPLTVFVTAKARF